MTLGAPLGLLALLGAAPLVAAYFLRRKQPPLRVSALFLWRDPSVRAEGGPRLNRFTRERSLFLELAAVGFAALFLADVRCGTVAHDRPPLAVVLDGSLSMSARAPGRLSAAERAVALVEERLAGAGPVTLVRSGSPPRLLAGPDGSGDEVRRALRGYRPQQGHHPLAEALELARSLSGAGRVLLLTDHVPEGPLPEWVELEALGEPLENDAITYATRRDRAGEATIVLRVSHLGASPATVRLELSAPSNEGGAPLHETRTLALGPGTSHLVQAILAHAGPAEVRLVREGSGDDALAVDGKLILHPDEERPVGVAILPGVPAAEREAIERFVALQPDVFADADAPLLRFGGPNDGADAGGRADVVFAAAGERRAFLGPFFVDKAHPVLEDVETRGVVWSAGSSPSGHPLISAGGRVLLAEGEHGRLTFNLDLSRSNLPRAAAWPILLSNVVRRARARLPGFARRQVPLGEELAVTVPAGAHVLIGPGDARLSLSPGVRLLPGPAEPGTYHLEGGGHEVARLDVLPIDPVESDLRARTTVRRPATTPEDAAPKPAPPPRPTWPLAALLGVLLVDYRWTRERA